MTVEEFLSARLSEEEGLQTVFPEGSAERAICANHIATMRHVLEWHKNWPVLVQTEPKFEFNMEDVSGYAFSLSSKIAWATQEEYRRTFGSEPPTSPILNVWVQQYRHHPDFQDEWLIK